jgi:hypothetical protein
LAEFAYFCPDLGNVDVEEADRVGLEFFLGRFFAFDLEQPGAPSHHGKLALAVAGSSDTRGHHVQEHCRKAGKIARKITLNPENPAHGLLAAGNAVEIAHWGK